MSGAKLEVGSGKLEEKQGGAPGATLQLVLATTLFVVASRIAYDHSAAASSIFTAFTRRAVP